MKPRVFSIDSLTIAINEFDKPAIFVGIYEIEKFTQVKLDGEIEITFPRGVTAEESMLIEEEIRLLKKFSWIKIQYH
jgi:hypothetical protein